MSAFLPFRYIVFEPTAILVSVKTSEETAAFHTMNGWNAYEVMLLYAFSLFAYGIAGTFFFNIMNLVPGQILRGTFDDVLVKPVKILPYLISSSFICNYAAHMTLSAIVVAALFFTAACFVFVRSAKCYKSSGS